MEKVKVWHNTRCSKSRNILAVLEARKIDYEVYEYLKNPPSQDQLAKLIQKMQSPVNELVRKSENEFKSLFSDVTLDEKIILNILTNHTSLIERPILETSNHAIVARPLERGEKFIDEKIQSIS